MNARELRWALRYEASAHRAYLPFARRRYPGAVVGSETELVIEGFTRSGITFALFAFHLAQPEPVRVAHHVHGAVQLLEAARLAIPALLVVREPEQSALSTIVREPFVGPATVLRAYVGYHRRLLPVRDRLAVADFEEVTGDFGAVVRRVNERFGTAFAAFDHTPENVERVFQLVEDRHRNPPWAGAVGRLERGEIGLPEYERAVAAAGGREILRPTVETRVARPSARREEMKEALRARVQAEGTLLAEATHVYENIRG